MKKIFILILALMISAPAWATLTANKVPVTKTGGSTPALQDSDITDVPSTSVTVAVPFTASSSITLGGVTETVWPAGGSMTSGSSILAGNGSGGFSNVTVGTGLLFTGGTLLTNLPSGEFKAIQFSYNVATASGTQTITGVGFTPKAVILLATINGTSYSSIGVDDGTNSGISASIGSSQYIGGGGASVAFYVDGSNKAEGNITTLGADGFTITWTKTGSLTGTAQIVALCLG